MTLLILIIITSGLFVGHFIFPDHLSDDVDYLSDIALYLLIFLIGISVGLNKHALKDLRQVGFKYLIIPLGTIIGSLVGGIVTGLILQMNLFHSLAIGSGFGYYSLSSVMLRDLVGDQIAAISLVTNVSRELLAIILIPFLAKKISGYTAVSIAGATSMDTTLPLIRKFTSERIALISFIHGVILTVLVPIFVNFFTAL